MSNDKDVIPLGKAIAIIVAVVISTVSLVGGVFLYGYHILNTNPNKSPQSDNSNQIHISTPTPEPTPDSTPISTLSPKSSWTEIIIDGDEDFVSNTEKALMLIEEKSFVGYQTVLTYLGCIKQQEASGQWATRGMWAWIDPPTMVERESAYTASTIVYASCIVHDAFHSKEYHDYLATHGYPPNDDIWTGYDAEQRALEFQIAFLEEVGAPQSEIEWYKSLRGTSWE